MTAVKSGLMIIDQHRAHVRILYEQYLKQLKEHTSHTQKMLFPEMVNLPTSNEATLQKVLSEMQTMGFELSNMGGGSYAVNGVPAGIEGLNISVLVGDMVASTLEDGSSVNEEIDKALALSLARNAAIPHGQVLGNEEMENLVNELFACNNVNYTPTGKTILTILKQLDIEKMLE